MARLTLAIDLNRCMNCKACNAACKEQNDVGIGYFWTWVDRKQSDKLEEDNGAPSHDFYYLPMQCLHQCRIFGFWITDNDIVFRNKEAVCNFPLC